MRPADEIVAELLQRHSSRCLDDAEDCAVVAASLLPIVQKLCDVEEWLGDTHAQWGDEGAIALRAEIQEVLK